MIPAKYTYVSGESKWKTNVISFAPTSEGITYEITYTSTKTKEVFTQAEVDAMSKEEIKMHKLFVSKITYTIPKDFEANKVNIFMGDAINNAANYMTYLPGDAAPIQIAIVNHSSHGYGYQNGSFAVTTCLLYTSLGGHGPMVREDFIRKLGEDIVDTFEIYNHNVFYNHVYLGTTSNGILPSSHPD